MSVLHYIDNEVPAYGEWDSKVEAGSSTIVQLADAAFPERGNVGLRMTTTGSQVYVRKNTSISIAANGDLYVGFWYNVSQFQASGSVSLLSINPSSDHAALFYQQPNGMAFWFAARTDASSWVSVAPSITLSVNRWYYMVLRLHRAATNVSADGYVALYIDGALKSQTANVDNYNKTASIAKMFLGGTYQYATGFVGDFDEIKIADSYPEPYVPTPETDYPEARRTVVLFRQDSSDSREFADYCVDQLSIPRCNLCPLPNATVNESLADYATFQTEVETDLAAWLALNPTVAANCSTFLIGYGVPGYFTSGGVKHSATSRLMNYGTAFSSETTNPLYNPATVARLTKTGLGGKYLCTRIDADTLAHAKTILDNGLSIDALPYLPDSEKLYSDESTYLSSLNCQHLRMQTNALATFTNDAFVWGDTTMYGFDGAGERALFCDDFDSSAVTIRSIANAVSQALLSAEYASALGNSETADTFDIDSFFEMLRIGGTLAEALAVSIANLDYTSVSVGSPLIQVAFSTCGYNLYRGIEDVLNIDFDTPVAYVRSGVSSLTLTPSPAVFATYKYALRAVRRGIETPGIDCYCDFTTDGAGDWIGNRPDAVINEGIVQQSGGILRAYWNYLTGTTAAADFALWYGTSVPTGAGAPDETVTYAGDGQIYHKDFTLTDGVSYYVRIAARTSGGVESQAVTVGPLAADASSPVTTTSLISQTY